jgi:hypothetical protein
VKAVWVDSGNDPNFALLANYGITAPFFDPRDPRVTAAYLDSIKAHAGIDTCGIYTAWNWQPEFSDPKVYVEWTDSELKRIGWQGNALVCLDIEKGNGVSDANYATYTASALTRWRQLRPTRKTWLTLEGMQGGLFSTALVTTIKQKKIRMAPQFFTGNMTPHRHSCVIDLEVPGVPADKIDGMYDAAVLPLRWVGFAFTQGRLPQ